MILIYRCAAEVTAAGLGFQDCKFGVLDTKVFREGRQTCSHSLASSFTWSHTSSLLPSLLSPFPPPFSLPLPSLPPSLPLSLPHRLLFARDDAFERVGEEGPTYSIDVVDDNYSTDIYRYNSCHWIFDNMYSEQASVFLEHVQNSLSCNSTFRIEKVNTLWLSVYWHWVFLELGRMLPDVLKLCLRWDLNFSTRGPHWDEEFDMLPGIRLHTECSVFLECI